MAITEAEGLSEEKELIHEAAEHSGSPKRILGVSMGKGNGAV